MGGQAWSWAVDIPGIYPYIGIVGAENTEYRFMSLRIRHIMVETIGLVKWQTCQPGEYVSKMHVCICRACRDITDGGIRWAGGGTGLQ